MSSPKSKSGFLPRYTAAERIVHWTVALAFVVAGISGAALFHPAFWFLSGLLGGGAWSHTLHTWAGVVMCLAFVPMVVWYWGDNIVRDYDRAWAGHLWDIMNNRFHGLPEIDKYNFGQKQLFWSLVVAMILLPMTGLVLWFDTDLKLSATVVQVAGLVHTVAAGLLFLGMIVHVYSAVFWVRGALRAMVRGDVKVSWARHHHPLWAKRVAGKGK